MLLEKKRVNNVYPIPYTGYIDRYYSTIKQQDSNSTIESDKPYHGLASKFDDSEAYDSTHLLIFTHTHTHVRYVE